jgi:hypothetical protein
MKMKSKTSAYQFICIADSTAIKNGLLNILVMPYATTRDFVGIEQYSFGNNNSLGFTIDVNLEQNVGAFYHWSQNDCVLKPITTWWNKGMQYVAIMFLNLYPLIIEILPNSMFIKIYYNDQCTQLCELINFFTDTANVEAQQSIQDARTRLNINIVLGDISSPEHPLCIY